MNQKVTDSVLPGHGLDQSKMPGHWLLAQMGKRVLRPGGLKLTQQMLARLDIQPGDAVVEFAPGLGVTARQKRYGPNACRRGTTGYFIYASYVSRRHGPTPCRREITAS